MLTGIIQEQSAHLVLPKDCHRGDIGQVQVSWSRVDVAAADAAASDEDEGRLQAVLQYNVAWTNSDDGSHGEMCLEPHVHKCSFPAKLPKYVISLS